jgi:diguanylate cyclase (GGDEF)-like protein
MHTIASKLARINLIVAISVIFSSGLLSLLYLYHHARVIAHENLTAQATALAVNLESAVAFGDASFAQQLLSSLRHYPDVRQAIVILPDGHEFARYLSGNERQDHGPPQHPAQADFMGYKRHGITQTIARQGEVLGYLSIVASLENLNREALLIFLATTAVGALILWAAYAMFRRLSQAVTRPIEGLSGVMRTVEQKGDYSQRTAIDSDDEIGELAQGFNSMLSALEERNDSLNTELHQRKIVQEELDHLAHYDSVTQLPNRRYFHERLNMAVAHSTRFDKLMAVVFVDLDNFKLVNDSYGHHIGDMQLKEVGERMSKSLRAGDVVCRLGGDEFAILLENLSSNEQIQPIVEKLIQNLLQPLRLDGRDIVVTGSLGVATCPEDAVTAESLLRFADTAMYAAKGAGKNTWRRFDPEMASQSALRLTLENLMRQGLREGQFEVHYQPQIDERAHAVTGFEALVRWNHPERGYISPAQFIPVAEESGLIRPLGEWVLRTACQQIVAWDRAGYEHLKVAVNVSVRQLAHASFVDQVFAILAETGCRTDQLDLEITESILMQRTGKTVAMLGKLRDRGLGIAIDDFGTGYSSMAQLKNMPVTKLKIDKSFVDDITTNRSDQAIAAAISGLAHNLRLNVIAEGVESGEQVTLLRQAGCDDFQGYFFARPLPASQIPKFLDAFY